MLVTTPNLKIQSMAQLRASINKANQTNQLLKFRIMSWWSKELQSKKSKAKKSKISSNKSSRRQKMAREVPLTPWLFVIGRFHYAMDKIRKKILIKVENRTKKKSIEIKKSGNKKLDISN